MAGKKQKAARGERERLAWTRLQAHTGEVRHAAHGFAVVGTLAADEGISARPARASVVCHAY